MGADFWTKCPRCIRRTQEERDAALERVGQQYGKVDSEQWREMIREAEKPIEDEETLPVYREVSISNEGLFTVRVNAACRTNGCGYEVNFTHEEDTDTTPVPATKRSPWI